MDVSGADFTNLKRQIRDAVSFLSRHRLALRRLKRIPGHEPLVAASPALYFEACGSRR